MGHLANKNCYLSGPIEHCPGGKNWRTEPMQVLKTRFGIDVFDPFSDPKQQWVPALEKARKEKNYAEIRTISRRFVRKDLHQVDKADFLIAHLPYKVATTGTHHEIINANERKIPTLLVCQDGIEKIPIWYHAFIKHEFMFSSWDALYEYLQKVDNEEYMDNDRWSIVYGLL